MGHLHCKNQLLLLLYLFILHIGQSTTIHDTSSTPSLSSARRVSSSRAESLDNMFGEVRRVGGTERGFGKDRRERMQQKRD